MAPTVIVIKATILHLVILEIVSNALWVWSAVKVAQLVTEPMLIVMIVAPT